MFKNHIEFFRQFRQRYETTGAIAPSSRFLAKSMTWPAEQATSTRRIIEVGPGTGAVTNRLVTILKPGDRLDLVEINEQFAELLRKRFETEESWKKVADQCQVHVCPLQDFKSDQPYDYLISGLPMNNFPSQLVAELLEVCFGLLKEGGVMSYFEYIYIRSIKKRISKAADRKRLAEIDNIASTWQKEFRFQRDWIFLNIPPAWVQHLRKPLVDRPTPKPPTSDSA